MDQAVMLHFISPDINMLVQVEQYCYVLLIDSLKTPQRSLSVPYTCQIQLTSIKSNSPACSNKKLLVTSASLLGTSALLVVTRCY